MPPRRKLQLIVAGSTAMSFIAATVAMYFATARYDVSTRQAQIDRATQFVERYVQEVVWQKHLEEVAALAGDIAAESELRNAMAASDHAALLRLLPLAGRRFSVTSGEISLLGITVYDQHGALIAEHMSRPGLRATGDLASRLAARERNERLERLPHVWTFDGAPILSIAAPVGGLKTITGYLAVHVDPLHALRDLDSRLAMQVLFKAIDGAQRLGELNGYAIAEGAPTLDAEVVVRAPDASPLFRVEMRSDESQSVETMAAIRRWAFGVLFAVFVLISGTTLGLVLVVSHTMAREEAEAATAALKARRIEERNADLQQHNEELRRTQGAIEAQNQRFAAALNNMAHGMSMFDHDHRLVVCNSLYLRMYDLPAELGEPGTPFETILKARVAAGTTPQGADQFLAEVASTISHLQPYYRVNELRDGRFVEVAYQAMQDGGWVALHQDITAQKRAEMQVARMARHDALTGLANRVLFQEKMDEALGRLRRRGEKFCILLLDLDRFKSVNDTLGHPVGDLLLKQVAERLRSAVRETDTIARLGGDEFGVLAPVEHDHLQEQAALTERLLAAIAQPYDVEDHYVVTGGSIGIAVAPEDGTDVHELLRNADLALYRAKAEGKTGYCFFQTEMYEEARVLRRIETDLRAAVEKGEFELHYQPIVSAASKEVLGVEALVRWRHPERGLVPPAEFIPIAEQTGLIVPLGEWVLRKACRDAAQWPAHLKLAVNLSAAQFKRGNLVEVVAATLAETGFPAQRLELEITESVILEKDAANVAVLHELSKLGVAIVLDDFGTGYSSLGYLQMFPFDKIKIDRSFVAEMSKRDDQSAMVAAITGLARSLEIRTTAEGVETATQLELLRAAGCNELQGYLFGRPCPASQLSFAPASRDGQHVA